MSQRGEGALDLTAKQFSDIQIARLTFSIISIAVNLIAIVVFLYLALYHPSRVNRPSLRCAAFCCLATFIENIFYVLMVAVHGESKFCLAMAYLVQYFIILGVTLLALIGINLVLVYVVNFRKRHILEYIYYPFAIIYSGVGLVGPIFNYYHGNRKQVLPKNPNGTCWYVNFMQNRYGQSLSFMWFYGFVFFATIIALLSSAVAIFKIVKDSQLLSNLCKSRQRSTSSNKLPQVIIRCVLYPLVPLLSNFLGFLLQCMITIPHYFPGYAFTMSSTVLRGFGGVLVSLIFLNDPAITYVLLGWYDHWYYKYVVEYVNVESTSNHSVGLLRGIGKVSKNTIQGEHAITVLASFPRSKKSPATSSSRSFCCYGDCMRNRHPLYRARVSHNDNDNKNNLVLGVDCPDISTTSTSSEGVTKSRKNYNDVDDVDVDDGDDDDDGDKNTKTYSHHSTKKIPMRRLKLPTSSLNLFMENHYFTPDILLRRSFSRNITVEEPVNGYFIVVDENSQDDSYIYINYTSDRHAKFIHCLFDNFIGRAFRRRSNFVIDVNISVETMKTQYGHDPTTTSSDPTEEL